MRIVQLEIENFRGVRHGRVVLPDHCAAVMRAGELLQDLALLAAGKSPLNVRWTSYAAAGGTIVYTAGHITRV